MPTRTATLRLLSEETPPMANAACGHSRIEQSQSTSSFASRLALTATVRRLFPRLYGLALEVRSFHDRISLVWRRGSVRSLRMGPAFEPERLGVPQYLVRNRRTQARRQDIQKLLFGSPFLSPEDCHLYLLGWDAGSEFRAHADTKDNSRGAVEQNSRPQLYTDNEQ